MASKSRKKSSTQSSLTRSRSHRRSQPSPKSKPSSKTSKSSKSSKARASSPRQPQAKPASSQSAYDPKAIEAKWQKKWQQQKIYQVDTSKKPAGKKYYCLDMLPYPSGAGMHVGHVEGYTATDIISRYLRMNGYQVIHPMGWDSFGLPAENYALKVHRHPKQLNQELVANFKSQLQNLGFSYDWTKEINTCDPEYIRWTQWFFLLLYKHGLAYRAEAPVNWCPSCQTVLAAEQVINGHCERCGHQVIQKMLKQWFFKITAYADRLLSDLDFLDWPESTKLGQRNWIGRKQGANIKFEIRSSKSKTNPNDRNLKFSAGSHFKPRHSEPDEIGSKNPLRSRYQSFEIDSTTVEVFTTRPDTLHGATFMVLAPEHPLLTDLKSCIKNFPRVQAYINQTKKKTELERKEGVKTKTGVKLQGLSAVNPVNRQEIPIFVADYVLMEYGQGAVMGVPAHDERDWEFAHQFQLPIRQVISVENFSDQNWMDVFADSGRIINSGSWNGWRYPEDLNKVLDWLEEQGIGRRQTAYKLRDWLISRQRYWGAPIPIVYCPNCGEVPLPEDQLPLELPDIKNIQPKGQAPLASDPDFVNTTCPRCSGPATRETDTMDGFVDNSWYYFRYLDPHNSRQFCGPVQLQHWMPVDLYVGGAEHTVGHLTYSRFFTKVLHDQGFVNFPEPFLKLRHPGIVLAEDGRKMSKRWDNVIDPNQVVKLHGADSVRLYEMFMGPFSDSIPWSSQGLIGCRRFLDKVWRLCHDPQKTSSSTTSPQLLPHLHRLIQKVGDDIPDFKFNTAISSMMEFINLWSGEGEHLNLHDARKFLLILAPFAPHITEELWQHLNLTRNSKPETRNHKSIHQHSWPEFAKDLTTEEQVEIPVQVNGKLRATLQLATRNSQLETKVKELALADPKVVKWTTGKTIVKTIFVPGKLINFVVE